VDEWDSVVILNIHPFIQEGNRPKWEFKVTIAQMQQRPCIPCTKTEVDQAVLEY